jgi:RNA polymerase sigma-70 factor (ECF subfamily)
MLGLAFALTGSWSVAEDLAHEAFVRALGSWRKVSRHEHPEAWVRRVVLNLSASRFRRLGTEARAMAKFASRSERDLVSAAPVIEPDFWAAVRQLPRRQAQAVALHYLEDLPIDEVARTMGCAEGTAKAHLHAARAALAQRLEAKGHASP